VVTIVFQELPGNFFFPLASPHRNHYAELLLVYYSLFMEYHTGIEREQVVSAFEDYFDKLPDLGVFQEDTEPENSISEEKPEDKEGKEEKEEIAAPRTLASRFLRRLLYYGWVNEEELADFTRIINLSSYAKPFFDALYTVSRGIQVEYESHVIAVYSSLCGDAVKENGHLSVMNAHEHTRLLVESLKILEQNIKTHIQQMYEEDAEVKEILHIHYDIYMNEVVDKAYTRLKTSENLSKYRPAINKTIRELLFDAPWMTRTAEKFSVIKRVPVEEAKRLLLLMLKEIRDDLRGIDPILEEIDDKNRRYSRISTEKIKANLYTGASLKGKISDILKSLCSEDGGPAPVKPKDLAWGIYSAGFFDAGSLYNRRPGASQLEGLKKPEPSDFDLEYAEKELTMRIEKQLGPKKIADFLSRYVPPDGTAVPAENIITDMESFIRLVYAAAYSEKRMESFPYQVRWEEGTAKSGRFSFQRHSLFKGATYE
jgi:hypothetical protein